MARNPHETQPAAEPAPKNEIPTRGGSYRRDPKTGELTPVEQPAPIAGEPQE